MSNYFRTSMAVLVAVGLALPAAASASEVTTVAGVGAQVHVGGVRASTSVQAQVQGNVGGSNQQQNGQVSATGSAQAGERGNATSTTAHDRNQVREETVLAARLGLHLESSTTPVQTAAQLQNSIQIREQELEQSASSSVGVSQSVLRSAIPMQVAVHALLASKDMLGTNIGAQVSQVAQQLNQSVQTTANAELQVKERGFWTRLFFGGDTQAANTIKAAVAQNQARITQLTQLLAQANVSASVKTQLQTQIQAMQQEQVHLQALAQQQASAWGIFSWRF